MVLRMLPPRLTSGTRSSARTIRLQSILAVAAENADALTAGKAAVHLLHGAQEVCKSGFPHFSAGRVAPDRREPLQRIVDPAQKPRSCSSEQPAAPLRSTDTFPLPSA
jgi:hypothetical protein